MGQSGALSTVHREHWQPAGGRGLGIEGIDNQTDRGHTKWGTLGHCQRYIQRALASSQMEPIGAPSTVHIEGTGNQQGVGGGWAQRVQVTRQTVDTHSGAYWYTNKRKPV